MTESKKILNPTLARRIVSHKDFEQLLNIQTHSISRLTDTYTAKEINTWINYIKNETPNRYAKFKNLGYTDKDNNLIAFVSWTVEGHSANIECLYTLAPYRGRQIGAFLLEEAEKNLINKTIYIRSTLNAQSFYRKNGYHVTGYGKSRAGFKIALLEKQTIPKSDDIIYA